MYWLIALTVFIGGAIISWITLNHKWRKIVGYPSGLMEGMIQFTRTLNPDLPGHPRFMDLKWTIIRHAFVSIVSALLIYSLGDIGVVTWVICPLNFLYAFSVKGRYSYRKRMIAAMSAEREASLVELWTDLVNASKVCVVYSFVSAVVLCVLSATL